MTNSQAGFTIIEMIMVTVIIGLLSVFFLANLGETAINTTSRHQISSTIVADLRRAQSLTLAGSVFQGTVVCGYGLHYLDAGRYLIYAGAPEGTCAAANRNYQSGKDLMVETRNIKNDRLNVSGPGGVFPDIFFEAPDPKVYLNGSSSLTAAPASIYILPKNQICGSTCTKIDVYTSGKIDLIN